MVIKWLLNTIYQMSFYTYQACAQFSTYIEPSQVVSYGTLHAHNYRFPLFVFKGQPHLNSMQFCG